jgi:hypothetical protein
MPLRPWKPSWFDVFLVVLLFAMLGGTWYRNRVPQPQTGPFVLPAPVERKAPPAAKSEKVVPVAKAQMSAVLPMPRAVLFSVVLESVVKPKKGPGTVFYSLDGDPLKPRPPVVSFPWLTCVANASGLGVNGCYQLEGGAVIDERVRGEFQEWQDVAKVLRIDYCESALKDAFDVIEVRWSGKPSDEAEEQLRNGLALLLESLDRMIDGQGWVEEDGRVLRYHVGRVK